LDLFEICSSGKPPATCHPYFSTIPGFIARSPGHPSLGLDNYGQSLYYIRGAQPLRPQSNAQRAQRHRASSLLVIPVLMEVDAQEAIAAGSAVAWPMLMIQTPQPPSMSCRLPIQHVSYMVLDTTLFLSSLEEDRSAKRQLKWLSNHIIHASSPPTGCSVWAAPHPSTVCMMPVRRLLHLVCRSCRSPRPSRFPPSSSTTTAPPSSPGHPLIRACSSASGSLVQVPAPRITAEANQNGSRTPRQVKLIKPAKKAPVRRSG
jgi:hypothetical protein